MRSAVIVDDHPAIRLAVRSVLESSGLFKVVGAADSGGPRRSLSFASSNRPSSSSILTFRR